ncbi:CLUMA_CG018825, isoform A [Clunio marinus]|uniref:CLUMA_CG018825, isoform A n=1 Tax=Clunio marinus TaxID=568069 RepID=A0A1J1J011_9DIPT|nr:CLUMA_CG018825, isoform A [Clunio marinus]
MEEGFKVPIFPARPPKQEEKSAEDVEVTKPEIPYKIPKWNGPCPDQSYSFEVLKNGVIVEEVKNLQEKSFWMIGRLPSGSSGVDISAAHPTISRYHAVLQYKDTHSEDETNNEKKVESGWFIIDLDSTHGTFLNKMRIKPRIYVRVRVGHQLKFGNSTRNYILQGPPEDEESESAFTITELKEQKVQREAELRQKENDEKLKQQQMEKEKEEAGVSWGFTDDAEEEPDLNENPYAKTNNEELFLDDPKKTLRGFFEREGYDLEYRCDELSPGVFICRVELPIDDEYGKSIVCEVQHKGKKKECVVQCALESCRILDRHGVLRKANHEPRRSRKVQNDDDDSDDDIFFDRTGDVEKKRLKKLGSTSTEALSYDQLMEQDQQILDTINTKEHKLQLMVQLEKRQKLANDDDLDQFMNNLSNLDQKVDKFAISLIKTEIQQLKVESEKIKKLINIAKPSISLPPIASTKSKLPLFGKRNILSRNFGVKKSEISPLSVVCQKEEVKTFTVEEEEVEEGSNKRNESVDKSSSPTENVTKDLVEVSTKVVTSSDRDKDEPEDEPEVKKLKLESTSTSVKDNFKSTPEEHSPKKRKNRIRIRNRLRENIDMDDNDEYIDEEKISTWVAPENQSGDGTTHLNQKYGY